VQKRAKAVQHGRTCTGNAAQRSASARQAGRSHAYRRTTPYRRPGAFRAAGRRPSADSRAAQPLHAEGDKRVRAVLERIDAIEVQDIAPAAISPAYWRTLANQLTTRLPLPRLVYNPSDSVTVGWYRVEALHHRADPLQHFLFAGDIILTRLPPR